MVGTLVGFVAFGVIWFFLLKPKNNQALNEELKKSQIDLATREAEVKAAEEAKQDLANQLEEKKDEVKGLYEKVDEITKGVSDYKSISEEYKLISEKAINKHDVFGTRIKNWFEKLTTNVTYQGKLNQQI